jgi:hypothetical protein
VLWIVGISSEECRSVLQISISVKKICISLMKIYISVMKLFISVMQLSISVTIHCDFLSNENLLFSNTNLHFCNENLSFSNENLNFINESQHSSNADGESSQISDIFPDLYQLKIIVKLPYIFPQMKSCEVAISLHQKYSFPYLCFSLADIWQLRSFFNMKRYVKKPRRYDCQPCRSVFLES